MDYPTSELVKTADIKQLATWYRFLPSPGTKFINTNEFEEMLEREVKIIEQICIRFGKMGGFNPTLSKEIGWSK